MARSSTTANVGVRFCSDEGDLERTIDDSVDEWEALGWI